MNQQSQETYSISQVSERTGVTENRIRDWHEKGFLPEVQQISVGSRIHRRTYIVEDYFHHSLDKLFLILRHIYHRIAGCQDSQTDILGISFLMSQKLFAQGTQLRLGLTDQEKGH